jgi:hypothetical protein
MQPTSRRAATIGGSRSTTMMVVAGRGAHEGVTRPNLPVVTGLRRYGDVEMPRANTR